MPVSRSQKNREQATIRLLCDLEYDSALGRNIFWSTGAFNISIFKDFSDDPIPIPMSDLPVIAGNDNFEAIFGRFVETKKE